MAHNISKTKDLYQQSFSKWSRIIACSVFIIGFCR